MVVVELDDVVSGPCVGGSWCHTHLFGVWKGRVSCNGKWDHMWG